MILSCPACSGEVKFQSVASIFAVCSYCNSTLVRHDKAVESIGKMAQLPPDMSPVQISTGGKYQKTHFTIIGRKKLAWEHGMWNEWYVIFDDGRTGWLAEAQGNWAMSFADNSLVAPAVTDLTAGNSYRIGKNEYLLDDVKEATCAGSMGELPAQALKGTKFISADFTGDDGRFASVDYSSVVPTVYLGTYVDFDELKFTNLRQIDGW